MTKEEISHALLHMISTNVVTSETLGDGDRYALIIDSVSIADDSPYRKRTGKNEPYAENA